MITRILPRTIAAETSGDGGRLLDEIQGTPKWYHFETGNVNLRQTLCCFQGRVAFRHLLVSCQKDDRRSRLFPLL